MTLSHHWLYLWKPTLIACKVLAFLILLLGVPLRLRQCAHASCSHANSQLIHSTAIGIHQRLDCTNCDTALSVNVRLC
jgi:hypothetical protein